LFRQNFGEIPKALGGILDGKALGEIRRRSDGYEQRFHGLDFLLSNASAKESKLPYKNFSFHFNRFN
jgi:hypothetical protein